jgi:hypothetical protein
MIDSCSTLAILACAENKSLYVATVPVIKAKREPPLSVYTSIFTLEFLVSSITDAQTSMLPAPISGG